LTSNVLSTDSFGGTLNLFGNAAAGAELISYGGYTGGFTTVDLNGNPLPTSQLVYGANALNLLAQSTGPATWATGSGNWSVGPWSTPSAPNGRGQAAVLNNAASPLVSVVLDEPVTVGTLALGNTDGSTNSGFSISATGANALTLDNSGSTSHITVQGGTHVISAPIWLAGNLCVASTANSTLTLSGDISESTVGSALSLDDAGTLILSGSNGYTGGTFVKAGTLVVENPNGIPNGSSLTVGAGAASLFAGTMSGTMDSWSWSAAGGSVVFGAEVVVASGNSAAPSAVPEPGALVLLLAALGSVAACRRFSRRSKIAS
jgi:autotransporter-associated beta strand protein